MSGTSDVPYVMTSGDILAAYDEPAPTRRAPWLVAGGAGLLVLGLVGGVTYGVGALSGGGSQPESALPSGAFAFVKVDLDPSAGQKVDGFRFLRQFPALRDKLGGDDLRKAVFEGVAEGAGWQDVDFDSEVGPWLGQRVAVAAYPPRNLNSGDSPGDGGGDESEPGVVVAVAVTDADGAREGLAKLAAEAGDEGTPLGFVVAGDYALLAETQALADRAAEDAAGSTLAQDGDFSADLAEAGDGVMTAWIDAAGVTDSVGSDPALGMLGAPAWLGSGVSGRSTFVARFDGPDAFEVVGRVRDADTAGWASRPVRGLGQLPASSVAAVGVADGDELVLRTFASLQQSMAGKPAGDAAMMPSFKDMVSEGERALGIELPEDLAALFGDNFVAALDGTEPGEFGVGARVSTDVVRAERVLDAITKASGGGLPLERRRVGDDLVVASTPAQADRLASAGTLGEDPAFSRALPDLGDAHLAAWLDLEQLSQTILGGFGSEEGAAEADANLAPIEGLGMTVVSGTEGTATFRLRLVTS